MHACIHTYTLLGIPEKGFSASISEFEDNSDQVDVYSALFLDVLNEHALIKRIKIKARPNPFVTPEIIQLMKTCDVWHKSAMKTNDKLHWNTYKFFGQAVKREIRLAERIHVRLEIMNSLIFSAQTNH